MSKPRDPSAGDAAGDAADPRDSHQPMGAYFQREPHFQVPAVTAYFSSRRWAEAAAEALNKEGFTEVDIDRISQGGPRGSLSDTGFPIHLVREEDRSQRVADAAHPAVSGMSAPELLDSAPYLLTVLVNSAEERRRAAAVLENSKGRLR
ncbi:MAG TPA: hypothetical protein VK008_02175 [Sphingobacteriaceae bacterium]|nr:hypothetical protein [Sphingobacteriaceae bacterium]